MRTRMLRRAGLIAVAAGAVATLAACSSAPSASVDAGAETPAVTAAGPRIAVSYEGGILVLDGDTLEQVADLASEEFTRLNPAGDGRHVMVTMSEGFQVLDTAAGSIDEPELTDLVFAADAPGHVVRHGGRTILYADGTSDTTIFDTDALLAADDELPDAETVPGVEAHHGVSVVLEVVDLPEGVEYTFRDIARGPDDLAYILSRDGSVHVFDPAAGEITGAFPVIEAWEGPAEWQDAHPAIVVRGDIAYVTEPAADAIHAVDLRTGEIVASVTLDITPNEIAVAEG